jgi:hypothetical protein
MFWGLRNELRVIIKMNGLGQPVSLGSEKFARFGSLVVKVGDFCPIYYWIKIISNYYPNLRELV